MHARPEDEREWRVLRNAYTRLEALWLTPLPLRSTFEDEEKLLAFVPLGVDAASASDYVEQRLQFFRGLDVDWERRTGQGAAAVIDPYALLWGMPLTVEEGADSSSRGKESPRLRPGSRFGHAIRVTTTFAAVGAAMQCARLESQPKSAPLWHQFEMPALLRSYFDPPIAAAILRWLEPHEAWWGDRPGDAANVLAEALARATDDDRKLLLPELLLAAALGKIPASGRDFLLAEADHVIACANAGRSLERGQPPWTPEEIAPVQAGCLAIRLRPERQEPLDRTQELLGQAGDLLRAAGDDPRAEICRAGAHLRHALEAFVTTARSAADGQRQPP